jgi:hypothetical protein
MPTGKSDYDKWCDEVHKAKIATDDLTREWNLVAYRLRACSQPWFNHPYQPCPVSDAISITNRARRLLKRVGELKEWGVGLDVEPERLNHYRGLLEVLEELDISLTRVINESYALIAQAVRNQP